MEEHSVSPRGKRLYQVTCTLGVVIVLVFLIVSGISYWLVLDVVLWLVLLFYIKKFMYAEEFPGKKLTAWVVVISLLSVVFVGASYDETASWKNFNDLTFSYDFEWTPELMTSYAEQENYYEMSFAGPFYFGNFPGVNDYTKTYTEARAWRVKEMFKKVDETVEAANDLENTMKDLRGTLDWYGFNIIGLEPSAGEEVLELIDEANMNAFLNKGKLEFINALANDTTCPPRDPEEGYLCYSLYVSLQDIAESYTEEITDVNTMLASLYLTLETDENKEFKSLNKDLDKVMYPLMKKINKNYHELLYNNATLAREEKLLLTADYYFARDVVNYSKEELTKLEEALENYANDKDSLSKEDVEFMKELQDNLEDFINEFEDALDDIDEDSLISPDQLSFDHQGIIPVAYAIGNPFSWLGSQMKSMSDAALEVTAEGASLAWSATKSAASTATNITIAGVKHIGTTMGTTLDAVDATVKSTVDTALNVYYGADGATIVRDIKNNYTQVAKNYEEGKSGSEIYKNAAKVLESVEDLPQVLMEKAVGKGPTVNVLGFVAKTSIGFVTGAAKDMYTVLDPGASDADTLTSLASLVMTAAGGSQSILKGSEALKISTKSTKTLVTQAVEIAKKIDPTSITKVFKDGIFPTLKNAISRNSLSRYGEQLSGVMQKTWSSISNNSGAGYKYLKNNIKGGVTSAYEGLFSAATYKNAFKSMFGLADDGAHVTEHAIGYLNNIIGSTVDDQIKKNFKDFLTNVAVSDMGISLIDEMDQENLEEQKELVLRQTLAMYEKERATLNGDEDAGNIDDIIGSNNYIPTGNPELFIDIETGCIVDTNGNEVSCGDDGNLDEGDMEIIGGADHYAPDHYENGEDPYDYGEDNYNDDYDDEYQSLFEDGCWQLDDYGNWSYVCTGWNTEEEDNYEGGSTGDCDDTNLGNLSDCLQNKGIGSGSDY